MACLPIANRPIVAHQIKYLETNGVFNIYIVVHQDAASKTRAYLRDHYEPDERSNIYLVVIQDEETEATDALKMICLLQKDQEQRLTNIPDYELELYRRHGTRN